MEAVLGDRRDKSALGAAWDNLFGKLACFRPEAIGSRQPQQSRGTTGPTAKSLRGFFAELVPSSRPVRIGRS